MKKMEKGTPRPVPLWYQYEKSDRKTEVWHEVKLVTMLEHLIMTSHLNATFRVRIRAKK